MTQTASISQSVDDDEKQPKKGNEFTDLLHRKESGLKEASQGDRRQEFQGFGSYRGQCLTATNADPDWFYRCRGHHLHRM